MGVKMKIPVLVAEGELSWVAVPGYALCSIRDWMKAPKGQDAKDCSIRRRGTGQSLRRARRLFNRTSTLDLKLPQLELLTDLLDDDRRDGQPETILHPLFEDEQRSLHLLTERNRIN